MNLWIINDVLWIGNVFTCRLRNKKQHACFSDCVGFLTTKYLFYNVYIDYPVKFSILPNFNFINIPQAFHMFNWNININIKQQFYSGQQILYCFRQNSSSIALLLKCDSQIDNRDSITNDPTVPMIRCHDNKIEVGHHKFSSSC